MWCLYHVISVNSKMLFKKLDFVNMIFLKQEPEFILL